MAKKPKALLTKRKQAWAGKFKPAVLRGKPLNYNAGAQEAYMKALERLVKEMMAETNKEILALFGSGTAHAFFKTGQDATISSQARILTNKLQDKYTQLFASRAKKLAEEMAAKQAKASKSSLHSSLKDLSGGLSLKTDILTDDLAEVVNAAVVENVGLIKSIAQKYQTDVQGAVMRSITTGRGLADLQPFLEEQEGVTKRRARNIALDQTRKTYSAINFHRMKAVGLTQFEWLHTGGSQKPRKLHQELSGQIFSFDKPPVIDEKTGVTGLPGQLINCGCRAIPVITFNNGASEEGAEEVEE